MILATVAGGGSVRLAAHGARIALAGLAGYGALDGRIDVAVNATLALAVALFPAVLSWRYGHETDPHLSLWIALAALAHGVGALGPYSVQSGPLSWYDQGAHAISASFVAGIGYALLAALDRTSARIQFPDTFRFVFTLSLILAVGVAWEIVEFAAGGGSPRRWAARRCSSSTGSTTSCSTSCSTPSPRPLSRSWPPATSPAWPRSSPAAFAGDVPRPTSIPGGVREPLFSPRDQRRPMPEDSDSDPDTDRVQESAERRQRERAERVEDAVSRAGDLLGERKYPTTSEELAVEYANEPLDLPNETESLGSVFDRIVDERYASADEAREALYRELTGRAGPDSEYNAGRDLDRLDEAVQDDVGESGASDM